MAMRGEHYEVVNRQSSAYKKINQLFAFDNCCSTPIVPNGEVIGWKKVGVRNFKDENSIGYALVKLRIPASAQIICNEKLNTTKSNPNSLKHRCSKAEVLEIKPLGNSADDYEIGSYYFCSIHDSNFIYAENTIVTPDKFSTSNNPCSNGIHFFFDKNSAIHYW